MMTMLMTTTHQTCMGNNMYVTCYLRVSSIDQKKGTGYQRQYEAVEKYCAEKKWDLQFVTRDSTSGENNLEQRCGLLQHLDVLSRMDSDEKIIVVENADRWTRDVLVGELLLEECRKLDIKVYSANGDSDLTPLSNDPTTVAMRQMMFVMAQYNKAVANNRMRIAKILKRRETGGKGFSNNGVDGRKPFGVKNRAERETLKRMIDLHRVGMSDFDISEELNNLGCRTRMEGKKWHRRTVAKIIKNPRTQEILENEDIFP